MLMIKESIYCGNCIAVEIYHPLFSLKGIPFYKIIESDPEDASDGAVINAVLYSV